MSEYSQIEMIDTLEKPNIIELKNITQTYKNSKGPIIENLNLLIEQTPGNGEFVVILGKSGCGKSTLLRYIAGLQTPSSGEVLIYDKPRSEHPNIGMVFQQYSSFPWLTVQENVELGLKYQNVSKKDRRDKAREMIKFVGLEGHEKKYAQYPSLSGGQLQRVAIARSLVVEPDILLMDEPFGALDIETRIHMQDLLCDLWNKLKFVVVFITHELTEAVYLADDVYVMKPNPAQIVKHFKIELPVERTREIKKTTEFVTLTREIESVMLDIEINCNTIK